MGRLGNYLRKHVPDLTARVENKLEVELGIIDVLPYPKYLDEVLAGGDPDPSVTTITRLISTPLNYFMEFFRVQALSGESTIYYSRNPLHMLCSERDMTQLALRELTRIAHSRLLGLPILGDEFFNRVPRDIAEGFAEYVAIEIVKDLGMVPNLIPRTNGSYERYDKFKRKLTAEEISSFEETKKYVLTFNPNS